MQGKNLKRAPINGDGLILDVKNIFKTIQGEGPFVGMVSVFIRLGGCNLACKFCDTDFENFVSLSLDNIVNEVVGLTKNLPYKPLIVITGGEPFRQNIEPLCSSLLDFGFQVQIETNGTLYRQLPNKVQIVCSPKPTSFGYSKLRDDLLPHISAIKFLVAKNIPEYSEIAEIGQSKYDVPVFVQPIDQYDKRLNLDNTELAISIAMKNGYRLSIQLHKVLGIE